ncbi:MAG: hypothetical protein H8E16_19805 [Flavobacteriales bacterium]|nr:hypothetical protein [Flavobacteriales bacterium]
MNKLEKTAITSNRQIIFGLICIVTFGLSIRFFYFPSDTPIVVDGYISFVYAIKTVFDGSLPIGYSTTNSGWSYLLSSIFIFLEKSDPLQLMDIQRSVSIGLASITAVPIFFILRKFTNVRWALFGSFLIVIEPRLVLISIEGVNYPLFFFLFVLSVALFLKKTNLSLVISFSCIAFLALVRYEGILLLIPFCIMYFVRFRNKRSFYRFLAIILVMSIILVPIGILRMEATQGKCIEYIFGTVCGQDGITNNVLVGPRSFYQFMLLNENVSKSTLETEASTAGFLQENYGTNQINFINALEESFSRLGKFITISLIPIFGLFILFNMITRIRNKIRLGFDSKFILFCSIIMLFPALYAYARGIDEIRYVLFLIPLFCIMSTSWNKSISKRISKNHIMILLVISIIVISILFIEMNKRDSMHDKESFLVSKNVVELTDVINRFHQDGYIKTAVLVHDWPQLPEVNKDGKVIHRFQKVSLGNFEDIQELITNARENGLEYVVIDKDNISFENIDNYSTRYTYLDKIFDSKELDFKNEFSIYKINYKLFDKNLDG